MSLFNMNGVKIGQIKRGVTQEALKGDVSKGDIWKSDFSVKFAHDITILSALSKANPQGKRHLDRERAVWTTLRAGKYKFEMSWFKM